MGKKGMDCQCLNWATTNAKSFKKTGHHPDCPLGAKKRPQKKTGKRNAEEYRLQCAIVEILQVLENQRLIRGFYHWPNGMRVSIGQAVKFKKMGMRKGPWDLYIVLNSGDVVWLECKAKKGALSKEQELFQYIHAGNHHVHWLEVRSVDDAVETLKHFGVVFPSCFVPAWRERHDIKATQNRVGERGDPSTADPREREPVKGTQKDQVR